MEEKEIVSQKEKEQTLKSMNSAMDRLKNLASSNTKEVEPEETEFNLEEKIKPVETPAKEAKEETISVDYELNNEQLAPKILEEETEVLTEEEDAKENKKFAWLAYILFFIPLLINKRSPFIRLHANEALDVFIVDLLATTCVLCGKLIPFASTLAIIGHVLVLLGIGLFSLTLITKIFQIIQVARGKKTQTPWLWKARFIK